MKKYLCYMVYILLNYGVFEASAPGEDLVSVPISARSKRTDFPISISPELIQADEDTRTAHIQLSLDRCVFADPLNDDCFKMLFVNNRIRLKSFLNSVLRLKGSKRIKSLEYLSQEQPDHFSKSIVVDVVCKDREGCVYIVEMQRKLRDLKMLPRGTAFLKRLQFYASKVYSSQLLVGGEYVSLCPVIILSVLETNIFPDKEDYISLHGTLDLKTHEHNFDQLIYCVIELPKYCTLKVKHKRSPKFLSTEKQWLDLLTIDKDTYQIPPRTIKTVESAYETLRHAKWNRMAKLAYVKSQLNYMIIEDYIEDAVAKTKATAHADKLESAHKMKRRGYKVTDIAEDLGLSVQEIAKL